ncbi:uncharacterized protein LOC141590255 [Silene latifolia]|uniref:uncharacterized protein LOC141590255 n=1 Tax=Silene latifolia TaxID=37657 RepID=UPI003D785A33
MAWKPGLSSSMNLWITRWVNGEYPEPRNDLFSLDFFGLRNIAIRALQKSVGTAEELSWHEDFVRQLFSEESANGILALPICRSRNMDEVYWKHTNKGEYSVKSGYGVLQRGYMERKGTLKDKTRLNKEGRDLCKNRLWQLPGPAVWKVLVWRILTDTLSVRINFAKRNMDLDHSCKLYNHDGMVMETMEHLFRDCEVARRIWMCSELGIQTAVCPPIALAKWIINWLHYLEKMVDAESRLVRFLAMLWCLWCTRNRVTFKRESFHSIMFFNMWTQVVRTADQAIEKARKAHDLTVMNGQDLVEDGLGWIRDSNHIHMIGTGSRLYEFSKAIVAESAIQAEAIGVKEVLLWAKSSGFWHLEVSSDCLSLICHFAGIERAHHLAT